MSLEHSPSRDAARADASAAAESPPPGMAPLAWSIDEYSEVSGLGRSFIYEAIRSGELQARKAGRRTLILRDDGERYLRSLPSIGAAA